MNDPSELPQTFLGQNTSTRDQNKHKNALCKDLPRRAKVLPRGARSALPKPRIQPPSHGAYTCPPVGLLPVTPKIAQNQSNLAQIGFTLSRYMF